MAGRTPRNGTDRPRWLLRAAIERARLALADDLAGVDDPDWDTQSLCSEWNIRHVVAHLTSCAARRRGESFAGLVSSGFNYHRFTTRDALVKGAIEPARLLAALKETAGSRHLAAMMMSVDVLIDVVCHTQDIRRPLGIPHRFDPAALLAVAEGIEGSWWTARWRRWSLVMAGRLVALDDVCISGVALFEEPARRG